jgi:hypothetical protein
MPDDLQILQGGVGHHVQGHPSDALHQAARKVERAFQDSVASSVASSVVAELSWATAPTKSPGFLSHVAAFVCPQSFGTVEVTALQTELTKHGATVIEVLDLSAATHVLCEQVAEACCACCVEADPETDTIAVNSQWLRDCVLQGRHLPVSPDDLRWIAHCPLSTTHTQHQPAATVLEGDLKDTAEVSMPVDYRDYWDSSHAKLPCRCIFAPRGASTSQHSLHLGSGRRY